MKKDKQIEFVTSAQIEIDNIHYPVSLLKQVQCLLPLLSFDELYSGVVKFSKNDRNFILGDAKLFVIMFVEGVIFIESASL